MNNINPDVIMIGVFGATIVLMISVVFVVGILSPANRAMQQRLTKMRTRYAASARGKGGDAARKLLLYARESSLDSALKRLLPRPAELRQRLNQTGKTISLGHYALFNTISVIGASLLMAIASGMPVAAAILLGIFIGLFIPHFAVSRMIAMRQKKFTTLFPEAIDLIVRGLKSGLPVTESIFAVGREMDDPVGVEFRKISDDIRLGKTMSDALWSATDRLATQEFKFFVISLSVQQETGGNLAETLSNLSTILRSRQQMRLKIKAMSSEGRASAMIIGALPFIMFGIIMTMNPEYASVLYTDPRAQIASVGSLIWMGIGMFMISKMISFEI
jgi:tight adherence protein B